MQFLSHKETEKIIPLKEVICSYIRFFLLSQKNRMPTHRHFIIHKPFGYLTQFVYNQNRRRNKKLLGPLHDFPEGTMAIGRLDETSEGLLLLTTDGKVSEQVRSKKVEKEYYIQVDGVITDEAIAQLQTGVELSLIHI